MVSTAGATKCHISGPFLLLLEPFNTHMDCCSICHTYHVTHTHTAPLLILRIGFVLAIKAPRAGSDMWNLTLGAGNTFMSSPDTTTIYFMTVWHVRRRLLVDPDKYCLYHHRIVVITTDVQTFPFIFHFADKRQSMFVILLCKSRYEMLAPAEFSERFVYWLLRILLELCVVSIQSADGWCYCGIYSDAILPEKCDCSV